MKLADAFTAAVGTESPVEFVAYDGSRAGQSGSPTRIEVKSARAVELFMSSPGQVGLARAYVAGELEIRGDVLELFRALSDAKPRRIAPKNLLRLSREFAPYLLRRVPAPAEEKKLRGRRHSRERDAQAIEHHYDVSNQFYRLVLGPSMAYTCAVFPSAQATLEEAQAEKFDLVCRKLDLRPGMRLLDVGCGWGGMVRHAVQNYGVQAIGVTLSRQQAEWGQRAIEETGIGAMAEIRFGDYRDITETGFDAVSSIGLTEHIGKRNYPSYFRFLKSKMRPEARLLNHSIFRPTDEQRAYYHRTFINRYVFPDGEMTGPGSVVRAMTGQGLELRHEENIREHYAMTLHCWRDNLETHWDDAVAEVGERKARVWRLYMAAAEWGFICNRIQLHQFLGVNTAADGSSGMPLRPDFRAGLDTEESIIEQAEPASELVDATR